MQENSMSDISERETLEASIRKLYEPTNSIFSFAANHGVIWKGGDITPELMNLIDQYTASQVVEGKIADQKIITNLMNEYANTPIGKRLNGWEWLKKAQYSIAALKKDLKNGEQI